MHKITNNSFDVDQIYPKIDPGIFLQTSNMYAKFQPDWSMHRLVDDFCKVCEMTKKKTKKF